jgi:hypothetical protein
MNKIIFIFAAIAFLSGCATPFAEHVKTAQTEIEASFQKIGYTPRNVIKYKKVPRVKKDRKWEEKQISFLDLGSRNWKSLHEYFAHDADYSFDCHLTVGESESDIEKVRWFEFNLDKVYTVYRIGFIRRLKRKR